MTKTHIALAAVMAIAGWTAGAVAQTVGPDTLTIEQVIGDVLRNNDRLKSSEYMEESARREVGPAGAWDDPMLMLGAENLPPSLKFNEEMMTMKVIGLSQQIPYAGQKGLASKAQRATAEAAGEVRRQTTLDLIAAAKTAYADLYYHQELIAELERQRDLAEQLAVMVKTRVEANLAGTDELSAALAASWRVEAEILTHHDEAHTAHHRLDALRGVTTVEDMPIVAPPEFAPLPDTSQAWVDSARVHYAPLRQLERQSESYRLRAAMSRRMSWPMLELGASYGIREDLALADGHVEPQDNMWSFNARVSLPVFRGRKEREMARSMDAMQFESLAEAAQMEKDVAAQLRALHQRAEHYAEAVDLYRNRIIPADEDAFRNALAGYSAGKTALSDVISYAMAIYRDRSSLTQMQMAYATAMIESERYTTDADVFLGASNATQQGQQP